MFGEPEARLRCACGHGIAVDVRAEGERVATVVFLDDEPGSETCGERVRERPGCDARLGLHALAPPKKP